MPRPISLHSAPILQAQVWLRRENGLSGHRKVLIERVGVLIEREKVLSGHRKVLIERVGVLIRHGKDLIGHVEVLIERVEVLIGHVKVLIGCSGVLIERERALSRGEQGCIGREEDLIGCAKVFTSGPIIRWLQPLMAQQAE